MKKDVCALICVEEADAASKYPIMLHELSFQPVLRWIIDALELVGVESFWVAVPEAYIPVLETFFKEGQVCFFPSGKPISAGGLDSDLLIIAGPSLLTSGTLERLLWHDINAGEMLSLTGDDGNPARIYYMHADTARDLLSRDNGEMDVEDLINMWNGPIVPMVMPEGQGGAARLTSPLDVLLARQSLHAASIDFHTDRGVTFLDPATAHIGPNVLIGPDTTILPGVILEGQTVIGTDCEIGPSVTMRNVRCGERCLVNHSQIESSVLGDDVFVGPYAHIRPDCMLDDGVRVGAFVQLKNTRVGKNTVIPHLAYIGDADIGADANIASHVVTANFNGVTKNHTVIGDNAFVGCGSILVAPVQIGRGAWTAAGSVITENVPADGLGIARCRQTVKESWAQSYLKNLRENEEK
jgi:bifunctional UDP-N-acetylglucosamine pyrophosphorylase/glucosamine-1-phosphate N-acetyltransferase